jgi:ubiquitin-protein ligase
MSPIVHNPGQVPAPFPEVKGALEIPQQAFRAERLLGDRKEMENIRCPLISWQAEGEPVRAYLVTYQLRSFLSPAAWRDVHHVQFEFGPTYPLRAPVVLMLDEPPVFHPNVFADGRICIDPASWNPVEGLGSLVIRVAKMLLYFDTLTNPSSAANREAASWYLTNKASLPLDRHVAFPDPITGARSERSRLMVYRGRRK